MSLSLPPLLTQSSSPLLTTTPLDSPAPKKQKPIGTHDAKLCISVSAAIQHSKSHAEKPKKGVKKVKEEGEWYITFALGNWEGKSDALTADRTEWKEVRMVNITTTLLQSLHANPVPIALYKVLKRPKLTLDEMLTQLALTSDGSKTIKSDEKISRSPSRARPQNPSKAKSAKVRPASAPILRQSIHPHQHQSVDKTLFTAPSVSKPPSRASRPNTPLVYKIHPHQHTSPEKTLYPVVDDRFPRLGRTGRVPDEHLLVSQGILDLNSLILGDNWVNLVLHGPENHEVEDNKSTLSEVNVKLEVVEGEWINDVQKKILKPITFHFSSIVSLPHKPLTFADIHMRCKPLQVSLRALTEFTHLPNRTFLSGFYPQEHTIDMEARYILFAGGVGWERTLLELREAQWEVCIWDREPLYGSRASHIGWHGVAKFSIKGLLELGIMSSTAPTKLKFSLPVLSARMKDSQQTLLLPPPAMYLENSTEIKVLVQVATPLVARLTEEPRRNKVRIEEKNSSNVLPKLSGSVGTVREQSASARHRTKDRAMNSMLSEKLYSAVGLRIDAIDPQLSEFLIRTFSHINLHNIKSLGLEHILQSKKSSTSVKPLAENCPVEIISGMHVYDEQYHFLFLESKMEVLDFMLRDLPPSTRYLTSAPIRSADRTWFDHEDQFIIHLKLAENLDKIMAQTKTYLAGMSGLTNLWWHYQTTSSGFQLDLLPEYRDLWELIPQWCTQKSMNWTSLSKTEDPAGDISFQIDFLPIPIIKNVVTPLPPVERERRGIDASNPIFDAAVTYRKKVDWIRNNRAKFKVDGVQVVKPIRSKESGMYTYSIQALNTNKIQQAALTAELRRAGGIWEYDDGAPIVLGSLEEQEKSDRYNSRQQWRTKEGFRI